MNKKYLYLFFFMASIGLIYSSLSVMGRSSGSGIAGNTNAPSESSCTGCHSGTALQTSTTATADLIHKSNFLGGGYFPDSTYEMTIAFKKTSTSKFGFSLTVLKESDDSPVGTLTAVTGTAGTQASTSFVGGKTRSYVSHTSSTNSSTTTDSIYWKFKWKAPSSDIGKVRFYAVVNATNSNSQTSGDVIYAKEFSYGLSTLMPEAAILSNDTIVCAKETIALLGSGTNTPLEHEWKMIGGSPSSDTSLNSSVTFNAAGIRYATFRVRNQYGWSPLDSMKITVKTAPVANITNVGPITLCDGDSVELKASLQLNTQYKWFPGNISGRTIWVKDSGTYSVEATNTLSNCVTVSETIRVDVLPRPTLTITDIDKKDTVCNLFPVRYLIQTANTYDSAQVFVNDILKQTVSMDTISINPPAGDSFKVDVQLFNNGCASNVSNSIVKYTLPTPAVPVLSCGVTKDSSITISWTAIPNVSGYEVSADSGNTWIALGSTDLTYTINNLKKGVEIKLLGRSVSATACPKSSNAEVVCKTTPCVKPFNQIVWKNRVCQGTKESIVISGLTTTNYEVSINGIVQAMDSVLIIELQADSTLTISVIDLDQMECGAYGETKMIQVNPSINASYGILVNDSFCKMSEVTLDIDPKRAGISYEVFVQRNSDSEIRLDSFTTSGVYTTPILADSQKYRLQITEDVCQEVINVPTLFGVDLPNFTAVNSASWYYHTLKASEASSTYTWIDSKGVQANQSGDSVVYYLIAEKGQSQKFYVDGKNEFGCVKRDSVEFTVGDFLKVSQLSKDFTVYPNPNTLKKLYIENRSGVNQELILADAAGKLIKTISIQAGINSIDITDVSAGLYFILDEQGHLLEKLMRK